MHPQMPAVLVVNPSLPANTVTEFIAYAKANQQDQHGIRRHRTLPHVAAELSKIMTDVPLCSRAGFHHLSPRPPGGQVEASFSPIPTVREQIEAGKLRALSVTDAAPSSSLPRIPTPGEFGSGYEASAFNGVGAPKDTPIEILDKLNDAINAGLADPRHRKTCSAWQRASSNVPRRMR